MNCPKCGGDECRTADTRPAQGGRLIRRRRVCRACRFRFSTIEAPVGDVALMVEACGVTEAFAQVEQSTRALSASLAALQVVDPDD